MNKLDLKNQCLKITFLEINPPINDLIKNKEEISLIFQGYDNFYDFKKYLSLKIPIQLNSCKNSIMMTLLKSNNIFATGLFIIRPGEHNIIFNYENKKKGITKKTVNINNLLDCIKIKIFCEFDLNNNDKENSLSLNRNLNVNKFNDSGKKYIPKVNLMKPNNINKFRYSNQSKKNIEKEDKLISNNIYFKSFIKNNFNSSQEICLKSEYTTLQTEEINNFKQNNNTNVYNANLFKKRNPRYSSKTNKNSIPHNIEIKNNSKNKEKVFKANSKNFFNGIKNQYKKSGKSQMKANNSSLNLINQNHDTISTDNNELNSNNKKNSLKPTISFNKNSKRNIINTKKIKKLNNDKSLKASFDNIISRQIIEHVDISKKEDNTLNNSEKKRLLSINENLNQNENKKRKFNNNNITINSISTAGTKKNDLEFSLNSLQDYEDKNNINKNNFRPIISKVVKNERLQKKLKNNYLRNKNKNKCKYNKSFCQQSFTYKIFNDKDLNLNKRKNNSFLFKNHHNILDEIDSSLNHNEDIEIKNNISNDKIIDNKQKEGDNDDNNEYYEEDIELENYLKLKEDFNLLYDENYIQNINEDLLKLEIELFIEKMYELFSCYHIQMDEKILENQIIKRDYKKNIANYLKYVKLNNKMQFVKSQQQIKKCNLKDKGINLDKKNLENINVNINELEIFKIIFPDDNKTEKLKKIVSIILKKHGNKEMLDKKK